MSEKRKRIRAAIAKIEREGYAPNQVYLVPKRQNCWAVQSQGEAILPNGKKTLYVGTAGDPRYQQWHGLIERRKQLKEYRRALKALDIVERCSVPAESRSVEWYTPGEWIDLARQVLGTIDLDPASNATAQQWIQAKAFYARADNGLEQPWYGRVWCNPPYTEDGVNLTKLFLERGLQAYRAGTVEAAIFLVNRTGARWYSRILDEADAHIEIQDRIAFIDAQGRQQKSPRYYNDFLYLGGQPDRFKAAFVPYCR